MPTRQFEAINDLFCFDDLALFMKAYFDESGKHQQAPVISIVGLLMSGKTCKELQRRWLREAARKPNIPLPFHMSDCVAGSKQFAYLKNDEAAREDMQRRMIHVMRGLDIHSYGASVVRKDHNKTAALLRHNPRYRDPWFLGFEAAIQEMMFTSAESGKAHRMGFVFDRADEFKERALSLYDELIRLPSPHAARYGALTFESKDAVCALQAVDIVVYETNRWVVDCKLGHLPERWQLKLLRNYVDVQGKVFDREVLAVLTGLVAQDRAGKL